jgi:hypothetical protein
MLTGPTSKSDVSERAALDPLCSLRRMRAQPTHRNLAAYILHAVQPEVCTSGMLADFNQTFEACKVVATRALRWLQGSKSLAGRFQVIPVMIRR